MKKNNFLYILKAYKMSILIFTIIGFLIGYFISYGIINPYFKTYDVSINTTLDINELFSINYFNNYYSEFNNYNKKVKEENDSIILNNNLNIFIDFSTYNSGVTLYNNEVDKLNDPNLKKLTKIKSIASIDYENMLKSIKIDDLGNDNYIIHIKRKYFKDLFSSTNNSINYAKDRIVTYLNKVFSNDLSNIIIDNNVIDNSMNNYINALFVASAFIIIQLILLFVFSFKDMKIVNIFNNENIFKTPFHKKYWVEAKKFLFDLKSLVTIAILFSLMMCLKLISLPSGFANLGISLTFLVFAVIAMIYGPIAGLIVGFLSDIIGFFLFQGGDVFFPGYILDAMFAGFTYAIFLYKTKITFSRCLYSRIIVNLIINVIFGSLWYSILYLSDFSLNTYFTYMIFFSLPKNLFYLLPQSIVLFIVLKALVKPASRAGLVDYEIASNVTLL